MRLITVEGRSLEITYEGIFRCREHSTEIEKYFRDLFRDFGCDCWMVQLTRTMVPIEFQDFFETGSG